MTFSLRNRAILSGRVTSVLVNDKKKVCLSSATNKTTSLRFALHTLIGNFGKLKQPTRNVISFVQVTTPLVNLSDTTTQLFERRVKFCVRMTKRFAAHDHRRKHSLELCSSHTAREILSSNSVHATSSLLSK